MSAVVGPAVIGGWKSGTEPASFLPAELVRAAARVRETAFVVRESAQGRIGVGFGGEASASGLPLLATLPALYPEWLGDRAFCESHALRFPYLVGEMANGIATVRMVAEAARAGLLGFFGAAGLSYERVEAAVDELSRTLGRAHAWGVNLIHSPSEPALEERVAELLVRRGVERISASAFMALTPAVVRVSAAGLSTDASGRVVRPRTVFAKVSRPEVAQRFLSPAPEDLLRGLVSRGLLTENEASLARRVPVAECVTVEADSGGHTDNQALTALFPAMLALRDALAAKHEYARPIHVGAAGGLGTPGAVAAAFQLGAAYVMTGSVNQAALESGLSDAGRALLAQADLADVAMAPAADMFELGVEVQVLKRGTMFAARAKKLFEAYAAHESLEALPAEVRARLEREVFRAGLDDVWRECVAFWSKRDPAELARAEAEPKHRMALVFRWYLGMASRWAIAGEPTRVADFQIWCGPAMGAFNRWVAGSFLAPPENRTIVQIAHNLLEGAAVVTRAQQLRTFGAAMPTEAFQFRPRRLA